MALVAMMIQNLLAVSEQYIGLLLSWPSEQSISALPVPRSHIDEAVRVMIKALAVVDLGAYAIS